MSNDIIKIEAGAKFTSGVSGHEYEVTAVEVLYAVLSSEITVTIFMRVDGDGVTRFPVGVIAEAISDGGLVLVQP